MTIPVRSTKSGVGFRFSPTDEELVDHFLMGKIHSDADGENAVIPELKLCDYEPRELPDLIKKDSKDECGHFFSPCDYKYKASLRLNRVTKTGFWKPTGKLRPVINRRTKKVIGTKRSVVFYKRQHPHKPQKTSFILHEYDAIAKGKSKYLLYKLMQVEWDDEKIDNGESGEMVFSPCDPVSQVTVNSSCEESEVGEIMSGIADSGNQSNENEVNGSVEIEKEGCHMGFENQIPGKMIDDMFTSWPLIRPEKYGSEYLIQDQQGISESPNVDISTPAAEINDSWPEFLGGSPTFFDELEFLAEPEDGFYSGLWSPGDCLSFDCI